MMQYRLLLVLGMVLASIDASGQEVLNNTAPTSRSESDAAARAVIFQEQHVVDSGHGICLRAAKLPPEARLKFLRSWVIPDPSATRFRVTADFAAGAIDTNDTAHLVSPVYELIRLARELDQVDHLRSIVAACPPGTPTAELDRLTLLALIAIATDDATALDDALGQWLKRIQPDPALLQHSTVGMVLIAQTSIDLAHPSPQIREMLRSATYAYRAEYNRDTWLRHLVALSAQLDTMNRSESIDKRPVSATVPTQWHLANLERALEHGNAFPQPLWQLERGSYRNLSNYGDMLLLFQSPLLGDFSVEATATGFGYREAHVVVGGRWTGLVHDHQQIIIGDSRGELIRQSISPPLNDTNKYGFIRTRIDVQNQSATTWMNGRLIDRRPLPESGSPWLGVRTNYRVQGGVDDLQITGEPVIPEQFSLVDSPELLGWYDYYQSPGNSPNRLANWKVTIRRNDDGKANAEISHPRFFSMPTGSHVEQLLRYLRPIAEDGTIAFEFFYEPGQTAAHPVIGRNVYLLTENGVKRHRLTDGRFDRTDSRPDNGATMDDADPQALPLLTHQWNRAEVKRSGDTFTVVLNGQAVCEQRLAEDTPAPQFGIFHFADQTALRVRNPTWAGGWPKALPNVEEQQLANPLEEILAWTSDQPIQSFHHVFDETSIISGAFVSVQGNPIETAQATPDGLVVKQKSDDGYRGATVAPVIDVGGDFDLTVSFDQIELLSEVQKIATVLLDIHADTNDQDMAGLQSVQNRNNDRVVQCVRNLTIDGNTRRSYFAHQPADGSSGRLKLSRRGKTIYYLAADNDSHRFRLVGKETFPTADLKPRGIQLGVQTQGPDSLASVRFTELSVRAERLGGAATRNHKQYLAELDRQRDQLPLGFSHDFTKQPTTTSDFLSWSPDQKWDATERSLEVVAVGTDNWTATGLSVAHGFAGDFDISFQFSPTQFPTPKQGKQTQVFLQLELTDANRTQVSSILTKNDTGAVFCQMQARYRINGEYVYKTIGNQFVKDPSRLRLLRRGKDVVGIAGSQANDSEIVLGSAELNDNPIAPMGARLLLHTGGSERTSKMMLQSVRIHAAKTFELNATPFAVPATTAPTQRTDPNANTPQPPSLPSRILDSLRGLFN